MAKAKYQRNSRGIFETKIWDGTYNSDGSKHRKRLYSEKSSADLERQVNALRNQVENGSYIQYTDISLLSMQMYGWKRKKPAESTIHRQCTSGQSSIYLFWTVSG